MFDEVTMFERVESYAETLDRDRITQDLLTFPSRVELDFTVDYLNRLTIKQLRHLFASAIACLSPADREEARFPMPAMDTCVRC